MLDSIRQPNRPQSNDIAIQLAGCLGDERILEHPSVLSQQLFKSTFQMVKARLWIDSAGLFHKNGAEARARAQGEEAALLRPCLPSVQENIPTEMPQHTYIYIYMYELALAREGNYFLYFFEGGCIAGCCALSLASSLERVGKMMFGNFTDTQTRTIPKRNTNSTTNTETSLTSHLAQSR